MHLAILTGRLPATICAVLVAGTVTGLALVTSERMRTSASGAPLAPAEEVARPNHASSGGATVTEIRHAYAFDRTDADGSGVVIAIVDAYRDPNLAAELVAFDSAFGVQTMHGLTADDPCVLGVGPHPCFAESSPSGAAFIPTGWAMEVALDVEWAHAMAPGADIQVVETADGSIDALLAGVDRALLGPASVVSMSWGVAESAADLGRNRHFEGRRAAFVAAAGDSGYGRLSFPAASPYVLAVGGSALEIDAAGDRVGPETGWSGSSAGVSSVQARPLYQLGFNPSPGRAVPDVAYAASVGRGYLIYSTTAGLAGWLTVSADSAGAPQWAAILALADQLHHAVFSTTEPDRSPVYATSVRHPADFNRVIETAAPCEPSCVAGVWFGRLTGLGTPQVAALVRDLGD